MSPHRKASFKNIATKSQRLQVTQIVKICDTLRLRVFVAKNHLFGVYSNIKIFFEE